MCRITKTALTLDLVNYIERPPSQLWFGYSKLHWDSPYGANRNKRALEDSTTECHKKSVEVSHNLHLANNGLMFKDYC